MKGRVMMNDIAHKVNNQCPPAIDSEGRALASFEVS